MKKITLKNNIAWKLYFMSYFQYVSFEKYEGVYVVCVVEGFFSGDKCGNIIECNL